MSETLKLLIENPGSLALILFTIASLMFYCGVTYSTLKWMRHNMVTKDGLKITLNEFKNSLSDQFVTKEDLKTALAEFRNSLSEQFVTEKSCQERHTVLAVPIREHLEIMARLKSLEDNRDKA